MSPTFLVKIVCYTWRPFTITLASSAIICAGHCLILTSGLTIPAQIIADDASVIVKSLHM